MGVLRACGRGLWAVLVGAWHVGATFVGIVKGIRRGEM